MNANDDLDHEHFLDTVPRGELVNESNIATLHGWNSPWSGRFDIDYLAPTFRARGYEVDPFRYGWHLAVTGRNEEWGKKFANTVKRGSVVVAHSNGCLVTLLASYHTDKFDTVVLIAPAMDADVVFPPHVKRIICLYSPLDTGVRISSWLPGHPWGSAGVQGLKDSRAENIDRRLISPPAARSYVHLDWSFPSKRVAFANAVCDRLEGL